MKNAALTLLLFLVFLTVQAQKTQRGMVREQNSGKKTVTGVQVVFSEANPVISDNDGLFTLSFPRKKAGEWAFLEDVYKKDYELVNKKEIEQVKLSSDERLGVDVILAPAGKLDAARREYYDISDKALLAGFEREKKALRDKLQKAQLNQQEYEEKYQNLQTQYDQQQQQLTQLADKFARVNFDDVSPVYQEALELYKAGQIGQAIAKLESINPAKRTEEIIKEEKRIAETEKELDARRAALEEEKRRQIASLKLLADMYSVQFDPVKAESQYDQLLSLDSTDLEILWDAADFYRENHRYEKGMGVYRKIISHPEVEELLVGNAHGFLGDLYTATGNLPAALDAYTQSFNLFTKLRQDYPETSIYKAFLAIAGERLGWTHNALGNLNQALAYFEKGSELSKELYTTNPQDVNFKNSLAISYSNLGNIYRSMGNLDQALAFFEERSILCLELHISHPQHVGFKTNLAISYSKLGDTYMELGNLGQALVLFENYYQIEKELYASNPQNVDFKNSLAVSCQKLGDTNTALGNLDQALIYFLNNNQLEKELYTANPKNVIFKNNLAISYSKLSQIALAKSDRSTAKRHLLVAEKHLNELHQTSPQNVEYKKSLDIVRQVLEKLK